MCVVDELPNTVVFEPSPVVWYPITIWFVLLADNAFVVAPINIEFAEVWFADEPFARYCPDWNPKNMFVLPVVLS